MKNRKLLLVLSLLLALTISLTGTLAYLTDTDSAVNVMTLGNVKIEQYEKDAAGNDFQQNQPLYPAYYTGDDWKASTVVGGIDKVVSVKNVGSSEAYVRTILAFEAGKLTFSEFEKNIHLLFNSAVEAKLEWIKTTPIEVKGVNYYVACVDYDKLAGNTMADSSLLKIVMDKGATNEIVAQFGDTYEVIALSQAVQTKNMPSAEAAWKESFGEFTATNAAKWLDGLTVVPVTTVSTPDDLVAAFAEGGTVVLNSDIDMGRKMVTIDAGKAVHLDLNGHDIKTDLSGQGDKPTALFTVNKGASLTINGNGNVHVTANRTNNKVSVIINNDAGDVTINGGNYTMDYGTYDEGYLLPSFVDNNSNIGNANLTINGGTFTHTRNLFRNFSNAASHNGFKTVAKITINGGEFIAADGKAAIWNQKPHAGAPVGAGVVEINGGTFIGVTVDDDWAIIPETPAGDNVTIITHAKTNDDLSNALTSGETEIYVGTGTFTLPAAVENKTVTFKGCGDNTVLDFTQVNSASGASITFENMKFQGKNENVMNGFGIQNTTGHIAYKNCTFDGAVTNEYFGSVSYENCTFTGTGYITTYAVKSATFKNCTFDKADSRAVLVYSHGDNPVDVLIENCTFKAAAKGTTWSGDWTAAVEVDTTNIPTVGTSVTVNNCTFDANYSGIVRDKSAAGKDNAVILINGAAYTK